MGCGALCGSTIAVGQSTTRSKDIFRKLLYDIKPNNLLLSSFIYQQICKEFQVNPSRYYLRPTNKLQQNQCVPNDIKEKWKVILYGLDTNLKIYVNCLGYSQKNQKQSSESVQCTDSNQQQIQIGRNGIQLPKIYPHPAFSQIEKDKDRTFQLPQSQKSTFSTILKRIASFFPKMGYTQGINFIVCYLLKIGYSQQDAFWMFVHIALNKRYMLLGLFEDGFPLSTVYITIFKNVLKRQSSLVYHHFYEKLFMNDLLWIFKWFTTYFLCSFPLEMGMYVLNFVIEKGGLGFVNFAVALIKVLEKGLLKLQDDSQVSLFLDELRKLETFNRYIKIQEVLRYAYSINIRDEDCKDLNFETERPYSEYIAYWIIAQNLQKKSSKEDLAKQLEIHGNKFANMNQLRQYMNSILEKWYHTLLLERKEFVKANGISDRQKSNKMRIGQIKLIKSKSKDLIIKNFASDSKIVEQQEQHSSSSDQDTQKYSKQQAIIVPSPTILKNKFSHDDLRFSQSQIDETASASYSKGYSDELSYQGNNRTKKLNLNKNPSKINQLWDQEDDFEPFKDRKKKHNTFNIKKVDVENYYQQPTNSQTIETNNIKKRSNTKKSELLKDINEKSQHNALHDSNESHNVKKQDIPKTKYDDLRMKVKTEEGKINLSYKSNNIKNNDILSLVNYDQTAEASGRNVFLKKQSDSISQASDASQLELAISHKIKQKVNNSNKIFMAGKSIIMSSMSVSKSSISNKSSTSSRHTNSKNDFNGKNQKRQAGSHRYCNCDKNKTGDNLRKRNNDHDHDHDHEDHDPQDIIDRSIGRKTNITYKDNYKQKLAFAESDKKTSPTYQQWVINSNSQGPQYNHIKQNQSISYEAQLYEGDLFKKKNRRGLEIVKGIGLLTVDNQNSNEKSKQSSIILQMHTLRNDQEQSSYESIMIQNFSQNQSSGISARNCDAFQIQSVK